MTVDDDPNDPFNDDEDDDDEVEDQLNQLDPGLIVFSNLTGAHQQLSKFSETTDLSGMVWNGLKYLRCLRCLRCLTA